MITANMTDDPYYTSSQTVDYFVTIGGVNFRMSEYAGATARGTKEIKIILKSGAELIADTNFEDFIAYLRSQIEEHNAT